MVFLLRCRTTGNRIENNMSAELVPIIHSIFLASTLSSLSALQLGDDALGGFGWSTPPDDSRSTEEPIPFCGG